MDDVHREALLGARLGEVEALAVLQGDAQGERSLAGARRAVGEPVPPVEPARAGEVRDEVQPVRVEVEELAVPRHARDRAALQGGGRRVVRLQDAHGDGQDADDLVPHQVLGEEVRQRFDLGKFRHTSRVPPGTDSAR